MGYRIYTHRKVELHFADGAVVSALLKDQVLRRAMVLRQQLAIDAGAARVAVEQERVKREGGTPSPEALETAMDLQAKLNDLFCRTFDDAVESVEGYEWDTPDGAPPGNWRELIPPSHKTEFVAGAFQRIEEQDRLVVPEGNSGRPSDASPAADEADVQGGSNAS